MRPPHPPPAPPIAGPHTPHALEESLTSTAARTHAPRRHAHPSQRSPPASRRRQHRKPHPAAPNGYRPSPASPIYPQPPAPAHNSPACPHGSADHPDPPDAAPARSTQPSP